MYIDFEIRRFADALASREPTPGGGAAAAATGVLGISLGIMAMRFSKDDRVRSMIERLLHLKELMEGAVDRDVEAYASVRAAYAMPKVSDKEKSNRREAIQLSLRGAAEEPLSSIRHMCDALACIDEFVPLCGRYLQSDCFSALILLDAGIRSCALNVKANTSSLSDRNLAETFTEQLRALLMQAGLYSEKWQ